MTDQNDTPPAGGRALPGWLLPAVIFGAVAIVAALVTFALTMRDLPGQRATITADALPTGHPEISATAAADSTALPVAHGSLDPNGAKVDLISLADARARLDAGTAIFIDVRTGSDYSAGHIPGALTITAKDLDARITALPAGSLIITYGDSARPEAGQRGAQIFMDQGYPRMLALEGGFQDWQKAGNPVEK
jgi:rhodanese-related sulfurtransferase